MARQKNQVAQPEIKRVPTDHQRDQQREGTQEVEEEGLDFLDDETLATIVESELRERDGSKSRAALLAFEELARRSGYDD